jgi:hypothetical protein
MVESLLLSAVRISTSQGQTPLTNASGFFFARAGRLFLVSSRHVFIDEATEHLPDLITIELHVDRTNLTRSIGFSIPLYSNGLSTWRQATDTSGEVDVAVVEIDLSAFPTDALYTAFTPEHIHDSIDHVEIGSSMLVVGFPLGFHDTLHHLPVVRQAINASTLKFRFQGMGYFLTDARTHRGTSGACVVMPSDNQSDTLPWKLIGIHSARLDLGTRDLKLDEALGLNCTWFADVLIPLTED